MEYIIFTATIPSALTGADIVIFASSFAYISDVSSVENRTLRVTILDACYLLTFPIGIALGTTPTSLFSVFLFGASFNICFFPGSYLFKLVGHSYSIMFSINASIMVAAILYSAIRLKVTNNFPMSLKTKQYRDM